MVLEINSQFVPIDVKAMQFEKGRWRAKGKSAKGVYEVCVNPETEEIRWPYKNRKRDPKCPPGLEDFWS